MTPERIKQYRLSEKLGEGGMGVVYRAQDEELNRSVAIKLLSGKCAEDPSAVERFHREARITAALHHPHICTVYEFGDFADHPYMVMELLHGHDLQAEAAACGGKVVVDAPVDQAFMFFTPAGEPRFLQPGEVKRTIDREYHPVAGNALRWRYVLALPVDGKVYHVDFDDWMFLMDDKVMLNRSAMSKWGFHLGDVTLSFHKR